MELGTSWYFIRHGYTTYDNVKSNIKQQEIKDQVAATKWLWEVASKLQIQRKKGFYFSFDFGWYSIHFNFVCYKQGGWGGYCLTDKIHQVWQKLFVSSP